MTDGSPTPPNLFDAARRRGRRRRLLGGLAVLVAVPAVLVTALWTGGTARVAPPREVTLLIDVSGSMRANDVEPSRLGAAVKATESFVDGLPKSVRVGVVAFSDVATVVAPPTTNRIRLAGALGSLTPESGTALGSGLAVAVRLTRSDAGTSVRPRETDIVLVSDGSQNRGETTPLQAAKEAKAAGIRVYGVALGTAGGSIALGAGRFVSRVSVPPDPNVVRRIAGETGGKAFVAQDTVQLGRAFASVQQQLGG